MTEIYNSVSDYLVTSVDFTSMIEQLMNYGFSEDQMYTVPGKTVEESRLTGNGMRSTMSMKMPWKNSL